MTLTIIIKMDSAAFDVNSGSEVSWILENLSRNYDGRDLFRGELEEIRDINSNTVGTAKVTD